MIDMVLKLLRQGVDGHITAMSRRGLLPHAHGDQPAFVHIQERPPIDVSRFVARSSNERGR